MDDHNSRKRRKRKTIEIKSGSWILRVKVMGENDDEIKIRFEKKIDGKYCTVSFFYFFL